MNIRAGILLSGLCVMIPFAAWGWQAAAEPCPYLDGGPQPSYALEFVYVPDSRTEAGRQYSLIELNLSADLVYLHNIWYGDMDFGVRFDSIFPLRDAGIKQPDHLMELVLESRWFWRYVNRTALELTLEPGFYTDTADALDMSLSMPVTVAGVYTVNRTLAAVAGISVRPAFNRVVMPKVGVVWEPVAELRLEVMVPETLLTLHVAEDWSAHAGWEWDSTTYHVKPDEAGRNRLTLESTTLHVGVTHALHEELRVTGSFGWVTDRRARSTRSRNRLRETVDIDDGVMLQIGVAGAF